MREALHSLSLLSAVPGSLPVVLCRVNIPIHVDEATGKGGQDMQAGEDFKLSAVFQ